MGSSSDKNTMERAGKILEELGISYEMKVLSAHRSPDLLFEYIAQVEKKGFKVIIAGAGGAAHLPGVIASKTMLPVIGVPIETKVLGGLDSLLSVVQMPGGVPVATLVQLWIQSLNQG
ncbi:MAG: 5-(carboxyamino)imidazole ribonucleotide mutase [Clostridia bacterium]|nr:5-(carboxyamino)imidazole ribonucleotide mutase [Clostridia bacterium]